MFLAYCSWCGIYSDCPEIGNDFFPICFDCLADFYTDIKRLDPSLLI